MKNKKQNNTIEANSNNYNNFNNAIFNNMRFKKKTIEQSNHVYENGRYNIKTKNNKNIKSSNKRQNADYLMNHNKLHNNGNYISNRLENYNKNTLNKDNDRINNKYVVDINESIKRGRNSSAPTLKQNNENKNINKYNTLKNSKNNDTSRIKKDNLSNVFYNNKILNQKKDKKIRDTESYENQKMTIKKEKEKEKEKIEPKNKIYDLSQRINNMKNNFKTNKKNFPSNLVNNHMKKNLLNDNYKDSTYDRMKNKKRKNTKNKEDDLYINLNIFKDILEKQEKISLLKKQLKYDKVTINSRNHDLYSFNSYNKSFGNNPSLNSKSHNKNHHNKSYDNSLNNKMNKDINNINDINDKASEFSKEKELEIDNEEKVLNIEEENNLEKMNNATETLNITDNLEKSGFNKTYENNLTLLNDMKKEKKDIDPDQLNTIEIGSNTSTNINKNVINTNFNIYNKNKMNNKKEKNNKKDKKIRILNVPKYNDFYYMKSSNIFQRINNNNNIKNNFNKTLMEKNNKSKISDNYLNKSKFNNSFEAKKNNLSSKRKKIKTDLYNETTNNAVKNMPVKKKALNSSKIKKHNVKIKTSNSIKETKSDKKLKLKGIDNIGCVCSPGEISFGKEKINQDNYFNYNLDMDNLIFIGVCDGHGDYGHFISDYLVKSLPKNFKNSYIELKRKLSDEPYSKIPKEQITKIFEESFSKTDIDLNALCEQISSSEDIPPEKVFNCEYSGSTCVSLLIPDKNIKEAYIANVGDSRLIVVKEEKPIKGKNNANNNWTFKQLSRDHKPTEEDEYQRIIEADGEIEAIEDDDGNWTGPLRVWEKGSEGPGLAMTRSLGDKVGAKIGVCCVPEVFKYEIKEEDKVFVIASDGLWEYVTNQEVTDLVKYIYEDMKKNGEINGDKMAKILHEKAVKSWREKEIGMDDITIICVILK